MAVTLMAAVVALAWLSPLALLAVGVAVTGAGLLASLAVGWAYHQRLQTAATRQGGLRAGWWWAPSRLHPTLDEAGRQQVLPMFKAGVGVVALAFVGMFLVAVSVAKAVLAGAHQ